MYLVDTHVLLWLVGDDQRLGPTTRRRLSAGQHPQVSAISILELTIKSMIGKVALPEDLERRLTDQGLRVSAFEARHAQALVRLPALARHDPFDRALLAQSSLEGLRFLTADRRLLALDLDWVDDATE